MSLLKKGTYFDFLMDKVKLCVNLPFEIGVAGFPDNCDGVASIRVDEEPSNISKAR